MKSKKKKESVEWSLINFLSVQNSGQQEKRQIYLIYKKRQIQ
jgi:hypothetical protein